MFTRQWPALCAWGAGLVHLAIAAGSSPLWAVLLGAIGAAELAWGVLRAPCGADDSSPRSCWAARSRPSASRLLAGLFGSFAGIPLAAASALLLVIAFAAAAVLRTEARRSPRRTTLRGRRGSDPDAP